MASLSALSVACTGALTHLLGSRFSWQSLAVTRSAAVFAAALMLVILARLPIPWHAPRSLWLRSLFGAGGMLCSFYAWSYLPIADAITLLSTTPIWVAAVSRLMLQERTGSGIWLSVVAGFVGVLLVQRPHLDHGGLAVSVALCGGFFNAMAMVGLRRVRHLDSRVVILHMSAVGFLAALIALGADRGGWPGALLGEPHNWLPALGLGLTATLAQLTLTRAYALGRAARVAVLGLLQIAFAAVFDALFWARRFDPETLLGMALILAPSIWLILSGGRPEAETDTVAAGAKSAHL